MSDDGLKIERNCWQLVMHAKERGLWIYVPDTDSWFTPDEFEKKYSSFKSGFSTFFNSVKLLDPATEIDKANIYADKMQLRVNEVRLKTSVLAQRVMKYWKQQHKEADARTKFKR